MSQASYRVTLAATAMGYIKPPSTASVASVGWQLTYIVSMASVLGVLSWNAGNKILGASHGVLFINFVPVTAFTICIIQGHRFEPIEFVGAALVIAALVGSYMVRHAATPKPRRSAVRKPAWLGPSRGIVRGCGA